MNPIIGAVAPALAPILARNQDRVLSLRFRKALGRRRQNPPESFYDKIFWMSVHADTALWSECADKVGVRAYVAERCGDGVLPNLYATYKCAKEIDFSVLPDAFAIKTNNGCASNYLVRSKAEANLEVIRSGLERWLHFPYGELTGQLHYATIPPRILAEELLLNEDDPRTSLTDYKFYCFGGEPRYCYVVSNRRFDAKHTHTRMMYNMKWKSMPEVFTPGKEFGYMPSPSCLDEMQDTAASLSAGIPFVRVDLYQVAGAVRFGEMTFMPGMDPGFTEEFQRMMGEGIALPALVRRDDARPIRGAVAAKAPSHAQGGVGDGHA